MKIIFAATALLISTNAFCADLRGGDLTTTDRKEIERTVRAYVVAFDRADFAALKKQVAPEFIDSVGGEEHLKQQLKAKSAVKNPRQLEAIRIVQKPAGTFVQFNIKKSAGHEAEIMEDDDWFRIAKVAGSWKLQRHESDFPLEDE